MVFTLLVGCAGAPASAPGAAPKDTTYTCEAPPEWGAVQAGEVSITLDGLPSTGDPLEWVFVAELELPLAEAEAAVCAGEALGDRTGRLNVWRAEDFTPEEDAGSRAPSVDLTGRAVQSVLLIAQGEMDTIAWAMFEVESETARSDAGFDPHVLY